MASIIKVDTIQTASGGTPTAADLGITIPSSSLPSGTVLQVVRSTVRTASSSTSSNTASEISTDYRVTITPKSTASKILVQFFAHIAVPASCYGSFLFYRSVAGGAFANINSGNGREVYRNPSGSSEFNSATLMVWDEPNTTSELIYTPYYWNQANNGPIYVNDNGMGSFMVVMEIAG